MTREQMIEKAARALYLDNYGTRMDWDDAPTFVQATYIARARVAIDAAFPGETTTEWGVRYAQPNGIFDGVRWDPTYGGQRLQEPYIEAEARADSARSGYPLVKRTRIEYEIEDVVTEWEPVD